MHICCEAKVRTIGSSFNPFHIHPLLVNIEHVDVPLVFVFTDHGIFCSIMYADS